MAAGASVGDAVPGLMQVVQDLDPANVRVGGDTVRLAPLQAAVPDLEAASRSIDAGARALAALPSSTWLGLVDRGRDRIAADIELIRGYVNAAKRVAQVLPTMLGKRHPADVLHRLAERSRAARDRRPAGRVRHRPRVPRDAALHALLQRRDAPPARPRPPHPDRARLRARLRLRLRAVAADLHLRRLERQPALPLRRAHLAGDVGDPQRPARQRRARARPHGAQLLPQRHRSGAVAQRPDDQRRKRRHR